MQITEQMEETQTNESPIVVGLDIGTSKIACIVAQRDRYGKLNVLGMGRADTNGGVQRGEVYNIQTTTEAIKKAVEEAQKNSGVEIKVVYVGIAGQHITSRQNRGIYTLPAADSEITNQYVKDMIDDMHKLALEPGERIIHVLPQEFVVDNNIKTKQPVGMYGSRLEADFHVITGKIAAAQNIKRCVERAGLQMLGLVLEPLASSASVLKAEEMEAGVALVDIGGGTTDIAIFEDNIIRHTAVIPYAGDIVTQDIKKECQVLRSQAEKLKVRFGCAIAQEAQDCEVITIQGIAGHEKKDISMRTLANIIQCRMEEIFSAVNFEIRNSGLQNNLIAGIVVTGGGSQMTHLKQLVEYVTGYQARIGYPTEHIARGTKDEIKNPMYATGLGLILKGYEVLAEDAENRNNKKKVERIVVEEKPQEEAPKETFQQMETLDSKPDVKSEPWWKKVNKDIKNWFADTGVNKDFEN
ncbi:MAG: cell division protein FtsA [Chitinophagales bacterium]|nr:cell division protein FtsA [Chitinophagales bacterium]HRN93632.1 cell division protein FtsA [Chitinophagales bacterium]HRP40163.1 cell division protein FtsA [Chitinophagales bacterium]